MSKPRYGTTDCVKCGTKGYKTKKIDGWFQRVCRNHYKG